MTANQLKGIAPDGKAILARAVVLLTESLEAANHGVGSNPNGEANNPEKEQSGNGDTRSC